MLFLSVSLTDTIVLFILFTLRDPWEALMCLFFWASLIGTLILSAFRDPWETLHVEFNVPFRNRFIINQTSSSDPFFTGETSLALLTVGIILSVVGLNSMADWVLVP